MSVSAPDLMDALPTPALLVDADNCVVRANPAACALLGDALEGAPLSLRRADGSAVEAEILEAPLASGLRLVTVRDVTDERRTASQLDDAGRIARIGVWEWHVPSNTVTWSRQMFRILALDPATTDPSFEAWLMSVHPDERGWVGELVQDAVAARAEYDFLHRAVQPDGTVIHMHCRGQVFLDEQGAPLRLVGASQDVTERVAQRAELDRVAGQREAILDAAGEGIFGLDAGGVVTFANPAAARLTGVSLDELVGRSLADMLVDERVLMRAGGEKLPVDSTSTPLRDGDEVRGAVVTVSDATERRRFEAQLQYLADHDVLTGLVNRRRFEEELGAQAAYATRYAASVAVLLLDVDHFKDVNDTRGHRVGDDLIRSVARVLRDRLGDQAVLARLGGDEFAVLLPAADGEHARRAAELLRGAIREHVLLSGGHPLRVTASIGVAAAEGADAAGDRLLADADVALYEAKDAGRDRVVVYQADCGGRERMEARLTWAARIRRALDRDEFVLYAQPIHDVRAGAITRHEVLLRLLDDDGRIVPPGVFLPVAERHGLIREIDRGVVSAAVAVAARERAAGRRARLEINLSGRSMGDPTLPGFIADTIAAAGADPADLVFEVTETAAIDSMQEARALALGLAELGCEFALDDFGAGFSSFVYLKQLPIDYVKIDGAFIRNLTTNTTDQMIVQALIAMARGLGKRTIAEFVEDEETLALLTAYGVDFLQGYHLGMPAPIDEALADAGHVLAQAG